ALAGHGPRDPEEAERARWPWPVFLLFLVWANLDTWFVVGLAVVALAWLGEALDLPALRGRALTRRAAWLAALIGVCLLTPSFAAAVAVPAAWRKLGLEGSPAAMLAGAVVSPFQSTYFSSPFGRSPAGLAYFALLGLGALSFLLNRHGWRWRWLLPWLGL